MHASITQNTNLGIFESRGPNAGPSKQLPSNNLFPEKYKGELSQIQDGIKNSKISQFNAKISLYDRQLRQLKDKYNESCKQVDEISNQIAQKHTELTKLIGYRDGNQHEQPETESSKLGQSNKQQLKRSDIPPGKIIRNTLPDNPQRDEVERSAQNIEVTNRVDIKGSPEQLVSSSPAVTNVQINDGQPGATDANDPPDQSLLDQQRSGPNAGGDGVGTNNKGVWGAIKAFTGPIAQRIGQLGGLIMKHLPSVLIIAAGAAVGGLVAGPAGAAIGAAAGIGIAYFHSQSKAKAAAASQAQQALSHEKNMKEQEQQTSAILSHPQFFKDLFKNDIVKQNWDPKLKQIRENHGKFDVPETLKQETDPTGQTINVFHDEDFKDVWLKFLNARDTFLQNPKNGKVTIPLRNAPQEDGMTEMDKKIARKSHAYHSALVELFNNDEVRGAFEKMIENNNSKSTQSAHQRQGASL